MQNTEISYSEIANTLRESGFAILEPATVATWLNASDWALFQKSWNELDLDTHMADQGSYRRRRYAVFHTHDDKIVHQQHQAHYQSLDYNPVNGGIERWFSPIIPEIVVSESLQQILSYAVSLFKGLKHAPNGWHIEVHQFRIEARTEETGKPTPEGMHRDGRDFVLVMMINRFNIRSGTTIIHDTEHNTLGEFTLREPMDTVLLDDNRIYHGVTAVEPENPDSIGVRDVLVVTLQTK